MPESPVYDPVTGLPLLTDIVSAGGQPAYADTPCFCCSSAKQIPPKVCGDHATCNDFCTGWAAIDPLTGFRFDRSECCDCPCPGRLAYPKCYTISAQFSIPATLDTDDPGGHHHHYELSPTTFFFNVSCGVGSDTNLHIDEYIDGVFANAGDFVVECVGSASAITGCPDRGKIGVSVSLGTVSGTGTVVLPRSTHFGDGGGNVGDACTGGSGIIVGNDVSFGGGGSFSVVPSCDDCPGHPPGTCGIINGADPTVCGSLTVQYEHDTGTQDGDGNEIWELKSATLGKIDTCQWRGGLPQLDIGTTPGPGPCFGCPPHDCNQCPDCGNCSTNWALDFGDEVVNLGGGSCPSGLFDGTLYRNIVVSSICP